MATWCCLLKLFGRRLPRPVSRKNSRTEIMLGCFIIDVVARVDSEHSMVVHGVVQRAERHDAAPKRKPEAVGHRSSSNGTFLAREGVPVSVSECLLSHETTSSSIQRAHIVIR